MASIHPVAVPYMHAFGYSPITRSYFSMDNVRRVMSMTLERVKALSGYLLSSQDERELVLAMRYVYASSCGPASVAELNKNVVDVCSRVIIRNVEEHLLHVENLKQGKQRVDPRPNVENRSRNDSMELVRFQE
jgi:hypothetical protein